MKPQVAGWHKYRLRLAVNRDHERRLREALVVQYGMDWKVAMDKSNGEISNVTPSPLYGPFIGSGRGPRRGD